MKISNKSKICFLLILMSLFCFTACDSRGRMNPNCRAVYSSETIQIPLKANVLVDGGYSARFYSKKTVQNIAKSIENIKEDGAVYTTQLYKNDTFVLIKKEKSQKTHYFLLINKEIGKDNYCLNNMRGYIEDESNGAFIIPYHLLESDVLDNFIDYFYGAKLFTANDKYKTESTVDEIYDFYTDADFDSIIKSENLIEITKYAADAVSGLFPQKTMVISFLQESGQNYITISLKN